MTTEIEKLVESIYCISYDLDAKKSFKDAINRIKKFLENNHFLKTKGYLKQLEEIENIINDLSWLKSDEDRLLHKRIQKQLANLTRIILEENKRIFVVHGRNISFRDKICTLLGKLKLDYVILESEYNEGLTVIEKLIKNSEECRYAIVLFSADDLGRFNQDNEQLRNRVRQNVVLELGYFLSKVGRKNIAILHEAGKDIESPSDFNGFVYEPFDEFGGWKAKLIKEMKKAGIYIDQNLADRV